MSDPAIATVAATLRQMAEWGLRFDDGSAESTRDELRDLARKVETLNTEDDFCCPMCEEVECDEGCPLDAVRARFRESHG